MTYADALRRAVDGAVAGDGFKLGGRRGGAEYLDRQPRLISADGTFISIHCSARAVCGGCGSGGCGGGVCGSLSSIYVYTKEFH